MGQLQSQRRARILVRPTQPLLCRHWHLRSLPQDERLHKGPVLLQHVEDGWLPDILRRRRRAMRHRVLRRHHVWRGAAQGRRLAGGRWRALLQRYCPVRGHGHSGMFSLRAARSSQQKQRNANTSRHSSLTTTTASGRAGTLTSRGLSAPQAGPSSS